MPTLSKETLELIVPFCEFEGVALSLVGAVFLFIAVTANWPLKKILDQEISEERRVAETDRMRTQGKLSTLQTDAANAKTELSRQQERAAKAEGETERIKGLVAWRTISPKEAADLEKVLAAHPGSVDLRYTDGDPEALYLAGQISEVLHKAKWRVAPGAVKFNNAVFFGIGLPDTAGEDAKTLRSAFSIANIPFSPEALPQIGSSFSLQTMLGAPTLMVGSKKPVLLP